MASFLQPALYYANSYKQVKKCTTKTKEITQNINYEITFFFICSMIHFVCIEKIEAEWAYSSFYGKAITKG